MNMIIAVIAVASGEGYVLAMAVVLSAALYGTGSTGGAGGLKAKLLEAFNTITGAIKTS